MSTRSEFKSITPFQFRFDEVLTQLDAKLNAYVEGDGSFVFSGRINDDRSWRVNGTIYEAEERIQTVEMWIDQCPLESLNAALEILGVKPYQCLYQLLTAGAFVDHESLCELAGVK